MSDLVLAGSARDWLFRIPCPAYDPQDLSRLAGIAEELRAAVSNHGVAGLAATQIGHHARVIAWRDGAGRITSLNDPKIVEHQGRSEAYTCSNPSFPERTFEVRHSPKILLQGYSLEGQPIRLPLEGYQARIVQQLVGLIEGSPPLP